MKSALETDKYVEMYESAANDLYLGGPGFNGSLSGLLGPLREYGADRRKDLSYVLQRPNPPQRGDDGLRSISEWNLDFTTPVEIFVRNGDTNVISVEDFIGGIVVTAEMDEEERSEISEDHITALSLAIRVLYEQDWLHHENLKLALDAESRLPQRGHELDSGDRLLTDSADLVLRGATITRMKKEMIESVRQAHNIAHSFPGTGEELMRDRALRALTRPEHEEGQYAISEDEASAILFDLDRGGLE